MRKATLFSSLALAACSAMAQSTVSLSGVADAAGRSVSNTGSGSLKSMVSGSNSTSRLAFRGTEDLGGGLSAGFHMETGVALDTGANTTATQFFDRRSTISLFGKGWGELRAGRDFVPSYVGWSRFDPFGYVGVGGSNNLVSATPTGPIRSAFSTSPNTTVRSSNSLQWFLPGGWAGVEGGVMVAAREGGLAANGQHKVIGVRLGWAGGPVAVSLANTTTENNLTTTGRFKDTSVGGSYAIGPLKVSAAWRQFTQNAAKQTNALVGASYVVGVGELKASVVRANLAGTVGNTTIDANDAQQLALGYVHNLSKRTALYGTYSRISNDGIATFAVPEDAAAPVAGKTSTGSEVGIRHTF